MFDPITEALIKSAPSFEGLDLEALPKKLTDAFARIVAMRIRLRRKGDPTDAGEITEALSELRRIAAAHEAYAALLANRENRAAAAFVAASAHQACMLARGETHHKSRIDVFTASPEICSTLLFLLADAHADASEAAKRISIDVENIKPVERSLLQAIKALAQGQLFEVLRLEIPEIDYTEADADGLALQGLQLILLRGMRALARQLRSRASVSADREGLATAHFLRAKKLCIEPIEGLSEAEGRVVSVYPGPLHIANLLLTLERDLVAAAIARLSPPNGLSEPGWWNIIRRMARQRPYLWLNHRRAIEKGYLERGISSAISFPTGGGKSTLAELKIASTLLRDEKVIFLAPTHALVGQTTRALQKTFQNFEIFGEIDDDTTSADDIELPEVTVTTPEQCLMLLSLKPEAFDGLGLIVFDECHLLHPRDGDRSHRGLDAMLAVLNLWKLSPTADFLLLSAMMKNTSEMAGWIKSFTGRECLALDLSWKPTRQVRGCVVYPSDQITEVRAKLFQARRERPLQKAVPAGVKRSLLAKPFGLFGLLQTWSTNKEEDYSLLPLLDDYHLLSSNSGLGKWYPTPNGNRSSTSLAVAAVASGMKTLVFLQTTVFCESCVTDFSKSTKTRGVKLNVEEANLYRLAVEEMGSPEHCYLQVDNEGVLKSGAASHHSLLLREERELHEGLFKRRDGIDVLFATSTLAQGMNLPSEVVIISGDSRFDPGADKMMRMEAHELLNAAGRAGRAGEGAQGFVLLVPSKIIEFDNQTGEVGSHWLELQSIFEQADQCLKIDDPFEDLLDKVHAGVTSGGLVTYFLSKLPLPGPDGDTADLLLRNSFAAYRARTAGNEQWIDTRVATALAARNGVELPADEKWIEQVSASTGLSFDILRRIIALADEGHFNGSAESIMEALLNWISEDPQILMALVRPESLEGLFGDKYKKLPSDLLRAEASIVAIRKLLPIWMAGAPICEMEKAFLGQTDKLGRCEYSRHFVSRVVPEVAFLAGLPARLLMSRAKFDSDESPMATVLANLGSVVREGCSSPEALAVRLNEGRLVSRVAARAVYEKLILIATSGPPNEDFKVTRQRMRDAEIRAMFTI